MITFKMEYLRVGSERGKLFSLKLLLFVALYNTLLANGQPQVGVSLQLRGEIIPNNSLVNLDDLLYVTNNDQPTNANGLETLMCVTDLEACCETEALGNWYYPDGRIVTGEAYIATFRTNRSQNEVINGQQFYGSVRLWRRYTPRERGLFRCELPDAENVTQTLYVNILFFTSIAYTVSVAISPSGSTTAGETYSLTCSATLNHRNPSLPDPDIPFPFFEWFFGPNGNGSLPSGLPFTGETVLNSLTYTSTLQFSPLSQSHSGNYTCRLGAGRLVNSAMVTVNAPALSVQITTSGAPMLGQGGYSLTCSVTGADNFNSSTTYQWTKNNGTQTQIQDGADLKVLSFSPLSLSDAGQYTCQATVSSPFLSNNITVMNSQDIILQIPAPTSIILSSDPTNPIPPFSGSDLTLNCTVSLLSGPGIDVPLNVNFELLRTDPAGSPLTTTTPSVSGSTYTTTAMISSLGRNDSGVYTCRATVSSASTNAYINDSNTEPSNSVRVTTGVYLALRGLHITNNSNINIRNIGLSSDRPNGALQCITDRIPCCLSLDLRLGEWYLPNRQLVQGMPSPTAFYRNRGNNGEVSLNRPSDVMSPTGRFCCEIPDATGTNQTLCVNIGELSLTASGSLVAGGNYTLMCSAGGSEGIFQWLGPPDSRTPVDDRPSNLNIVSTATSSQLQFRPIGQSDNGSYSCNVTVDGLALSSVPIVIGVNAPSVLVQISNDGATPTAGESYRLTCSVSGVDTLNPTIAYRWTKNSGGEIGMNSNVLFFTPLQLTDAARYICEVTISSSYLLRDIAMNSNPQDIRIQIPPPSSLALISSGTSDSVIVGADVTLTCTLVLNSAIVVSDLSLLMVDVQLSRDGTPLTLTGRTMTGIIFTYSTQLNSFGRSDSGNYTCTTTVRPQQTSTYLTGNETVLSIISIKAASAPPLNVRATQSSSSAPVEVSWSPPTDGDAIITRYRIYYGNGQSVLVPSVTAITSVSLKVDGNHVGRNVSIRSEADQLYSELLNVYIIKDVAIDMAVHSSSCSSEVGIAVGAVIVVECLVVIVITVIVVLCLWRRKSPDSPKNKNDFTVSANMAYGEVNLTPREVEGEYENPESILKPSGELTEATTNMYEAMDTRNPAASEYASTEETVCATHHSS